MKMPKTWGQWEHSPEAQGRRRPLSSSGTVISLLTQHFGGERGCVFQNKLKPSPTIKSFTGTQAYWSKCFERSQTFNEIIELTDASHHSSWETMEQMLKTLTLKDSSKVMQKIFLGLLHSQPCFHFGDVCGTVCICIYMEFVSGH